MELDFRFTDYVCKYKVGNKKYKGLCFSKCDVEKEGRYATITYYMDKEPNERNYIFITLEQMVEYLNEISKLLGFDIIFLQELESYYILQIKVAAKQRYFLYISTIIRYLYEYPYSIMVYFAIENRKNFPELNIIQIIHFYLGVFCYERLCHRIGLYDSVFTNMNSKAQFNMLLDGFNYSDSYVLINSSHSYFTEEFNHFNTKNLPALLDSVSTLANSYYEIYKKDICCW